jgi:type II secretory pathway pseudopilin PulG
MFKKLKSYNLPPTTYHLPPRTGFTLIELVLAFVIISALAATGALIYGKFYTSSKVNESATQLIQTIRIAKERAQSGVNNARYGVFFDTTNRKYTLYQGDCFSTCSPTIIRETTLDSGITLSVSGIAGSDPNDLNFAKSTGIPNVSSGGGNVTLSNTQTSESEIVGINTVGLVSPGSSAPRSLRFYGHGINAPDRDRVKIQIGDLDTSAATAPVGPPADVGAADFTIEFWMRAADGDNTSNTITCGATNGWINGNIIVDRDRYNQDRDFGISIAGGAGDNGRIAFGVGGNGTGERTICSATNVLTDTWHHIAVTRTFVDGVMRLFVDGILEASATAAEGPDGDISYPDAGVPGSFCPDGPDPDTLPDPCTNSDPYIVIGAEKHDAGAAFPSYSGFIDEFRISNNLRYTENFTPPSAPFITDANTMAFYHFDEGSGIAAADSSGQTDGTISDNGVLRVSEAPALPPHGPEWSSTISPFAVTPASALATTGQWTAPFTTPLVSIHMALIPNGNVLMWDSGDFNATPSVGSFVWNPTTDVHTIMNTPGFLAPNNNTFCAAQTSLPDGRVLVAGGHNGAAFVGITNTNILNFSPSESWVSEPVPPPMANARWYPTLTKLSDGRILVVSGTDTGSGSTVTAMQVYNPSTNAWITLTGANVALPTTSSAPYRVRPLYPFMFVVPPDGRVLYAGSDEAYTSTHAFTVTGTTGSWSSINTLELVGGSAAMYRPGRIIKAGTHGDTDLAAVPSVATAYTINTNALEPWSWTLTNPMNFPRAYHTLTPLPDGTVIVTGGTVNTGYQDPPTGGVARFEAEIWTPNPLDLSTGTWATMAPAQRRRAYHGNAILLPDGRVLVAGGGRLGGMTPQFEREIFSPPYLFRGPRPVISTAPATAGYAAPITITMSNSTTISSVALIALGAPTHGFDMNTRYVPLTFSQIGSTITATTPTNGNIAPPGYYMLFAVNNNGVPSVGRFIQIQ